MKSITLLAGRTYLTLLIVAPALSGCGLTAGPEPFESPPIKASAGSAPAETQMGPPLEPAAKVPLKQLKGAIGAESGIEVTWKVPEKPVEGFILHYGYEPDKLNHSVRLVKDDLEAIDHPEHGRIYRYVLKDVPPTKNVYISLSAFDQSASSQDSEVFEVKGNK